MSDQPKPATVSTEKLPPLKCGTPDYSSPKPTTGEWTGKMLAERRLIQSDNFTASEINAAIAELNRLLDESTLRRLLAVELERRQAAEEQLAAEREFHDIASRDAIEAKKKVQTLVDALAWYADESIYPLVATGHLKAVNALAKVK